MDLYDYEKCQIKNFFEVFQKKKIRSVVFNEFIDEIPDGCFEGCNLLEKINNLSNIKKMGGK